MGKSVSNVRKVPCLPHTLCKIEEFEIVAIEICGCQYFFSGDIFNNVSTQIPSSIEKL
jgi:hypothetical protein